MPENPLSPEEAQKTEKPQLSRRGFFSLFRGSRAEDLVDSDEHKQPKQSFFTRRRLLASGVIGGLIGAPIFILRTNVLQRIADAFTVDYYTPELLKDIEDLEKKYSCKIKMGLGNSNILSLLEKEILLSWLKCELEKYPSDYIKRINLTILCFKDVKYQMIVRLIGANLEHGFAFGLGFMNVISLDFINKRISFQRTFHHELEHASDARDGYENWNIDTETVRGELSYDDFLEQYRKRGLLPTQENDQEWSDLNPKGSLVYSREDIPWYRIDRVIAELRKSEMEIEGFTSRYGKTQEDEDQAEVVTLLMTDSKKAYQLAKEDRVLAAKLKKIKEYMLERSNGKMNDQYWKDLEGGKVDEDYWNNK